MTKCKCDVNAINAINVHTDSLIGVVQSSLREFDKCNDKNAMEFR